MNKQYKEVISDAARPDGEVLEAAISAYFDQAGTGAMQPGFDLDGVTKESVILANVNGILAKIDRKTCQFVDFWEEIIRDPMEDDDKVKDAAISLYQRECEKEGGTGCHVDKHNSTVWPTFITLRDSDNQVIVKIGRKSCKTF